jgi:hypothetical protein
MEDSFCEGKMKREGSECDNGKEEGYYGCRWWAGVFALELLFVDRDRRFVSLPGGSIASF